MDSFEESLAQELSVDFARNTELCDPVAEKIAEHRASIDQASRKIMAIERERDLSVREFESQLEQAEFVYTNAVAHCTRAIGKAKASAESRIAVQRRLLDSAEAALHPLEPFNAPKDEEAPKRRVPRVVPAL